jgi:hypothetical protein
MEQETQTLPDSRVWDNRATEVIAEARKMPLGDRRRAALREAGRLRIAAETYRWLATKQRVCASVRQRCSVWQ